MNLQTFMSNKLLALTTAVLLSAGLTTANATEPCDDFGECKVLIEINATDGDIGFHFLVDGDDLIHTVLFNPDHKKIFSYIARRELRKQFVTETFVESAEPLCDILLKEDDDDEVVTLEEFLDRWSAGNYHFFGIGDGWEFSHGETYLSFNLPAAPAEVDFDGFVISWEAGDDLGECATSDDLDALVGMGEDDLPTHPEDVTVAAWEVVFEPDVDDGDSTGALVYSVRVAGDISPMEITVPIEYLDSLPDDTPMKVEVGAIGVDDNATFSEEDGFCVNEVGGCGDD